MRGVICGDIIGSPYERGGTKDYDFELFIPKCKVTDDTIMTCAIAEAVMDTYEEAGLRDWDFLAWRSSVRMKEFGRRHMDFSYGGTFRKWLEGKVEDGYGSYGNGSAMRVSPVSWAYDELDDILDAAKATALPTHGSPEGIRGAQAIASAVFLARMEENDETIQQYIEEKFYYDYRTPLDALRENYSFDVTCQGSVPVALRAYHEATGFEDAMRLSVSMGGDSDTIAAMAGSIAEIRWEIPEKIWNRCEKLLPDDVAKTLSRWEEFVDGIC